MLWGLRLRHQTRSVRSRHWRPCCRQPRGQQRLLPTFGFSFFLKTKQNGFVWETLLNLRKSNKTRPSSPCCVFAVPDSTVANAGPCCASILRLLSFHVLTCVCALASLNGLMVTKVMALAGFSGDLQELSKFSYLTPAELSLLQEFQP